MRARVTHPGGYGVGMEPLVTGAPGLKLRVNPSSPARLALHVELGATRFPFGFLPGPFQLAATLRAGRLHVWPLSVSTLCGRTAPSPALLIEQAIRQGDAVLVLRGSLEVRGVLVQEVDVYASERLAAPLRRGPPALPQALRARVLHVAGLVLRRVLLRSGSPVPLSVERVLLVQHVRRGRGSLILVEVRELGEAVGVTGGLDAAQGPALLRALRDRRPFIGCDQDPTVRQDEGAYVRYDPTSGRLHLAGGWSEGVFDLPDGDRERLLRALLGVLHEGPREDMRRAAS